MQSKVVQFPTTNLSRSNQRLLRLRKLLTRSRQNYLRVVSALAVSEQTKELQILLEELQKSA